MKNKKMEEIYELMDKATQKLKALLGPESSGKSHSSLLSEIENAMERWHHGRDNDNETLDLINKLMCRGDYLKWFNDVT